jgi:predicted aspartyl protease
LGTFSYPIEVFSPDGLRSETVNATVDTGASFTCLPGNLLRELGITPTRKVLSELADGSMVEEQIGRAMVRVEGMEEITIVLFAGESAPALLGAYTLEGLLLAVDPVAKRLVPTHAIRYAHSNPLTVT